MSNYILLTCATICTILVLLNLLMDIKDKTTSSPKQILIQIVSTIICWVALYINSRI
jgi:hypothetical protein